MIVFFLLAMTLFAYSAHSQATHYPFVHQEFFHKPIFENDQMRVLNVLASQGDTTAFHKHCHPILYITVQGAWVSLKEPKGKWKEVQLPTGWIGQDIYAPDTCYVHQFSVIGEKDLHIVAIEALRDSKPQNFSFAPAHREDGFTLFEIDLLHLPEIVRTAVPVILVETASEGQGKVDVIGSDQLTKKLLRQKNAYAVFFEKLD